jgi:hypothetical protein
MWDSFWEYVWDIILCILIAIGAILAIIIILLVLCFLIAFFLGAGVLTKWVMGILLTIVVIAVTAFIMAWNDHH